MIKFHQYNERGIYFTIPFLKMKYHGICWVCDNIVSDVSLAEHFIFQPTPTHISPQNSQE